MKMLFISIDLVMGTRVLVNVLKAKDFKAHSLEINRMRYLDTFSEKAMDNIYRFSAGYDVVGLSFNSFNSVIAAQLGKYFKSRGVKWLITGGHHATAAPEEVIPYSDIVAIYEAELTLPKLLAHLKEGRPLDEVPGIIFKDKKGKIVNTGCPTIENNLDNIPFQSCSPEDITYYDFKTDKFDKPAFDSLFPHGGTNYFIMASRGCPFRCTYCSTNLLRKLNKDFMKIRKRSVPNVISEMEAAKQLGFKGFYICDDNFLAYTMEEIEEFVKLYRQKLGLPFGIIGLNPNNMRAANSAKKIDILLDSGLSDVRIGIQSGSNKTLKMFKRSYNAEELPGLLSAFKDRKTIWKSPHDKLRIVVDFICDSAWEDEKDKIDTLKTANDLLPIYGIQFNTLIYLPGTDVYEMALEKGWLKDKEKDIYLRGIVGIEDNIYNRLLYLIAVLKERGSRLPDEVLSHILEAHKKDPGLAEKLIDFMIKTVNDIEGHHGFNTTYLTLHPYLKGFSKWTKTAGQKGKKVLFRSYHEVYG